MSEPSNVAETSIGQHKIYISIAFQDMSMRVDSIWATLSESNMRLATRCAGNLRRFFVSAVTIILLE